MTQAAASDTGIAVLDKNMELLRVDKVYNMDDIKQYINNLTCKQNSIICVDLPKQSGNLNGKWRIESKYNKAFNLNDEYNSEQDWTERFCERGSDLCQSLKDTGYDVFRYNCYFTKNILNISPPYKHRSPAACKYLQMILKNQLNIEGIPSNMIPLSGLDAIIGAYTARAMAYGHENKTYKIIGDYKQLPVISAI